MEHNKKHSFISSADIDKTAFEANQILIPLLFIGLFFIFQYYLLGLIPYVGSWPTDLFISGLVLWGIGKILNIDFKGNWNLKFSKNQWSSVIGITTLSVAVLSIYFAYHPEVSKSFPLPTMPTYLIPFATLLMAIINGLREEFFFRFILQRCLSQNLHVYVAIILQALAFGLIHYEFGFPRGYLGVFLTTLFGILVGFQYHYFRSFTLTWFTHSLVDFIMFVIILMNR